jgi:hypothetical protein
MNVTKAFNNGAPVYDIALSGNGRFLAAGGRGWTGGVDAILKNVPAREEKVRIWHLEEILTR